MTRPTTDQLKAKKCKPCEGGAEPMTEEEARDMLQMAPGWELNGKAIEKEFKFKNFYETVAFVNAVAWIANREDHHPDLQVSYNRCKVTYSTHTIGGLSENDFISAVKINALIN
ncbi:MAG: 4a-hydroxytetrahydrobiopterin dehydratase [Lentisphaeria bacterium]